MIELLVAVGIVLVLTALIYPSYRDSVRQARRAVAQGDLLELMSISQRYFAEKGTLSGHCYYLPFDTSPKTGTAHYNLSCLLSSGSLNNSYYAVKAEIVDSSIGGCNGATLIVDSLGKKWAVKRGTTQKVAGCW